VIDAAGWSDRGPVRSTNEDCFAIDEGLRLFVVADGMGGHNAGEIASRLGVESVVGFIRRSREDADFSWPFGFDPALSHDGNRLRTAILLANARVFRTGQSTPACQGMGTTIATVLLSGSRVVVGHVGDSRVYVDVPGEGLTRLTQDDSWAAQMLPSRDGAALATHPYRNMLTSVVGAAEVIEVHLQERDLRGTGTLLLCSDGLHGAVPDDQIDELLHDREDLPTLARRLVQAAIDRGSCDNITALLVRYEVDV
jgi:protein phosphatase